MHPKKYLIAMLASCSTISALPVTDVVDLSICARSEYVSFPSHFNSSYTDIITSSSQSASCLRKRSAEDYYGGSDASYKRSVDTTDGNCARTE